MHSRTLSSPVGGSVVLHAALDPNTDDDHFWRSAFGFASLPRTSASFHARAPLTPNDISRSRQWQRRSAGGWSTRDGAIRQAKEKVRELSVPVSPLGSDKYAKEQLREQIRHWQEKAADLEAQVVKLEASSKRELEAASLLAHQREEDLVRKFSVVAGECEAQTKRAIAAEEAKSTAEMNLSELQRELNAQRHILKEERFEHSKSLKTFQTLERDVAYWKERYNEAHSEVEGAHAARQKAQVANTRREAELKQKESEMTYYKDLLAKQDFAPTPSAHPADHAALERVTERWKEAIRRAIDAEKRLEEQRDYRDAVADDNTKLRGELAVATETIATLRAELGSQAAQLASLQRDAHETCLASAVDFFLNHEESERQWLETECMTTWTLVDAMRDSELQFAKRRAAAQHDGFRGTGGKAEKPAAHLAGKGKVSKPSSGASASPQPPVAAKGGKKQ